MIPTADTDADVLRTVIEFADRRLGKGVVVAKDTPGFIANRLGIYGLMQVFKAMEAAGLTVAEVDAITGPAIGRPKSATFRTMDLAGIDILAAVARDLATQARCRGTAGLRPCLPSSNSWSPAAGTAPKPDAASTRRRSPATSTRSTFR